VAKRSGGCHGGIEVSFHHFVNSRNIILNDRSVNRHGFVIDIRWRAIDDICVTPSAIKEGSMFVASPRDGRVRRAQRRPFQSTAS
jgi:hypothetical protein